MLFFAWPAVSLAGPLVLKTDSGTIDWSAGEVRVVGVGTPRLLSPTGGLTDDDLLKAAQQDAESRIRRVLKRAPVTSARSLLQEPAWAPKARQLARKFKTQSIRRGSDGTIHLDARLPFSALGKGQPALDVVAPAGTETSITVRLAARVDPCLRVMLQSGDDPVVRFGVPRTPGGAVRLISWHDGPDAVAGAVIIKGSLASPSQDAMVIQVEGDGGPTQLAPGLLTSATSVRIVMPPAARRAP